jgi:hypothetical protein
MIRISVVQTWDISYLEGIKNFSILRTSARYSAILSLLHLYSFLYLFCYDLRVTPDEKSLNAELLGWLKPSDQPIIFYSVVGSGKLNLNRILQHITFRWDEHDASPYPFQTVGPVEIHYLRITQIIDAL